MKLRIYTLVIAATIVALIATTQKADSKKADPPAGNCGDPITNVTCGKSGCHGQTAQTDPSVFTMTIGTGSPTTPLNASFEYTPSTLYNIAFLMNNTSNNYGFQLTALTSTNAMAGSFGVTNATTTKINTSGPTQYMGHKNAGSTKNWAFQWTAPAAPEAVTFYWACNYGNGANNAAGDQIFKGSFTINAASVGMNELTGVENLNVYNTSNSVRVTYNSFSEGQLQLKVFNLAGQQLHSQTIYPTQGFQQLEVDATALVTGMYIVQLTDGINAISKKVVRQ